MQEPAAAVGILSRIAGVDSREGHLGVTAPLE